MNNQVDTVGDYLSTFINEIVNYAPKVIGALIILLIGYIFAKVLATAVRKALELAHLNQHLQAGKGGNVIQRAIPNPTNLLSKITYYLIMLFALSLAVSALGIPVLVDMVRSIYAYLPNVLAAIVIFLVAGAISAAVATLVTNAMGNTPTGKIAAAGAPVVVMGLAVFMILNQLKIAPEIVTITYAGLVGTATLAFGLGGKDAASRMFMGLYENGLKHKDTVVADSKKGAANAKSQAKDFQNKAR